MKAIFIDIAVDKAGTTEQRQFLQALREVVPAYEKACRTLYLGIRNRLPITRKHLKFFHPDDLAIGTAMLNKLETMAIGTADFLQRFPGHTEAEALE